MPIIYAEGFLEPPCFNPSRRASGFTREGVERGELDNEPITPILLPLVPEFINTEFHIYSYCTFKKILLEVVAIRRKNAG